MVGVANISFWILLVNNSWLLPLNIFPRPALSIRYSSNCVTGLVSRDDANALLVNASMNDVHCGPQLMLQRKLISALLFLPYWEESFQYKFEKGSSSYLSPWKNWLWAKLSGHCKRPSSLLGGNVFRSCSLLFVHLYVPYTRKCSNWIMCPELPRQKLTAQMMSGTGAGHCVQAIRVPDPTYELACVLHR